jgi:Predicted Fe-S oxidoreductases
MSVKQAMVKVALNKGLDMAFAKIEKDPVNGVVDAVKLVAEYMPNTKHDGVYTKTGNAFTNFPRYVQDPTSKWVKYGTHLVQEVDHNILKSLVVNLGYNAGYNGLEKVRQIRDEEHRNAPWVILFDPTSACNMHCTGCWAAEYGHKMNLSFEDMDRIVTEGKEMGIYFYLMTGGEPLVRKADVIKLCKKHSDCEFQVFTNGTLVDQAFCSDLLAVHNLTLNLSVEGYEEQNDSRRGEGCFNTVMKAMDLLKANKCLFGVSICYTSKNYQTVVSEEFLRMLQQKGCRYGWFFHYMPVGNEASTDLLLTPQQREEVYHKIRYMRSLDCDLEMALLDFQNDGEFVGGCIAGGKNYAHINANGDVEPCVFIHYSNANIHDMSLREALCQPLFREYGKNQAFNKNMLQPCPMLENPEFIKKMVDASGAKSTDLQSPETVEHLCSKCEKYAADWAPVADKLWNAKEHR